MSDWRDRAACAGIPITPGADPFFPEDLTGKPGQHIEGLDYCNGCPALIQCAQEALTLDRLQGVWAGVYFPNASNGRGRQRAFVKLRATARGKAS